MAQTGTSGVVASYLLLRKVLGWIGILLPIVLIAGDAIVRGTSLPGSVSGYYYTPMRNILVGALCVLGVFLVLYDVGVLAERWITNVAGVAVLGVALLPESPPVPHPGTTQQVVGGLHLFCALVAFIALSATIWRFARAGSDGPGSPAPPRGEASFYRAFAVIMLCFVALAVASEALPASVKGAALMPFVFEALAVITFGISWLVKGRSLRREQ